MLSVSFSLASSGEYEAETEGASWGGQLLPHGADLVCFMQALKADGHAVEERRCGGGREHFSQPPTPAPNPLPSQGQGQA